MDKQNAFILWFDQISNDDVAFVGGKNASLGEMYRTLTPQGVRVPNGFAITAKAYQYFLDQSGLRKQFKKSSQGLIRPT
jgi:pyruvate,water dikinase